MDKYTVTAILYLTLLGFGSAADMIEMPEKTTKSVFYLEPGDVMEYNPESRHRGFFANDLKTYCFRGSKKTLQRLFETVELRLDINGDDYTQYEGGSPEEVLDHYNQQRSLFSFSLFSQKRPRLQLSPFAQQCIGIETILPYKIELKQARIDLWRFIQLVCALLLFFYAHHLSNNPFFYYGTGIVVGICTSFLLLVLLVSRLVPQRPVMLGVLVGGWAVGMYILQLLWENLQMIVLTYRNYVFWYICITGLVSFFICYRWQPLKDKRSRDIVKWSLQFGSLVLVFYSSRFEEATASIIVMTLITYVFPAAIFYKIRAFYYRRFPPKRRLLSNAEYYEQGVRETTKALEELRAYCSSPECKQWRIMRKLRDPMRFATFVEGSPHLRDEEILSFENSSYSCDDGSDSSEEAKDGPGANGFDRTPLSYYTLREPSAGPSTSQQALHLNASFNGSYRLPSRSMIRTPQRTPQRTVAQQENSGESDN